VAGASPLSEGAAGNVQGVAGLAGLGAAAMGGDQAAFGQFMNPYQSQVIDQLNAQFDRMRQGATLNANDAATQAHAFGGSRHGVAEGQQLADLNRNQAATTAQMLSSGFNDAQGRAYNAANLGLTANQQQFGMGDYFRQIQQQYLSDNQNQFNNARDYNQNQLGWLNGLLTGQPYSQTQSTPTSRNVLSGAAGGAAQGAAVAGAPGAIAGGIFGMLGV
jgi:hypothetical protein